MTDQDLTLAVERLRGDLAPLVGRWVAALAGQDPDTCQLRLAELTVAEQLLPAAAAEIAASAAAAAAAAGADYVAIGAAADMSRQAARKRWPGLVPQVRGVPAARREPAPAAAEPAPAPASVGSDTTPAYRLMFAADRWTLSADGMTADHATFGAADQDEAHDWATAVVADAGWHVGHWQPVLGSEADYTAVLRGRAAKRT